MSTIADLLDGRGQLVPEKAFAYINECVDKLINLIESDFDTEKYGHFTMQEKLKLMTLFSRGASLKAKFLEKHRNVVEYYMDNYLKPRVEGMEDVDLIIAVETVWKRHCLVKHWLKRFFLKLDENPNNHTDKEEAGKNLEETAHSLFNEKIFSIVKYPVAAVFHKQLMKDREGTNIDRNMLRGCSDLFITMDTAIKESNVYADLEAALIDYLRTYARSLATSWVDEKSVSEYLRKSQYFFEDELERCNECLEKRSQQPVRRTLEQVFVEEKKNEILYKPTGLRFMLENDKREDLSRLFRLFHGVNEGLEDISKVVNGFIIDTGSRIIEQREQKVKENPSKDTRVDEDYVKQLLSLLEEWRNKVRNEFGDHRLLQKALTQAFQVLVNKQAKFKHSNIELLAAYSDQVLKGSLKLNEIELEAEIDRIVEMLDFVYEKDLFIDIYRNLLAKRLLSGRTASRDAEKSVVSKLKLRHGAQFTGKIEGMIREEEGSAEQMSRFAEWRDREVEKGENGAFGNVGRFDFNVRVLTHGWWPNFVQVQVRLPDLFETCERAFEQFYFSTAQNRRLTWQHTEGIALLKGRFIGKKSQETRSYELTVKTLQAVFLLLLDELGEQSLDLKELVRRTQITTLEDAGEEVAKRVLHSLSCNKHFKIVEKSPPEPKIKPKDKFKLNNHFSSKLRRFQIPMVSLEEAHDPQKLENYRRAAIDATIVSVYVLVWLTSVYTLAACRCR
eukprot:gb/GECG01006122.1/.p1 GENE.gb/GECG01006122.1/~~gb/GECG01006122.1/.p1  ORF type:complete len:729 (+),score=107.42 gb/GECG01006122.1/:1-2187(+)